MSRTGPITRDTSSVALGLAQIRVGASAANIATTSAVLTASDSIGALSNTKFAGNVDFWKLESGFPLQEDLTIPLRETNMLECAFKEMSPYNLALARGIDPGTQAQAATITPGSIIPASGTLGTQVVGASSVVLATVSDYTATTSETWTVVFDSATTYSVYGSVSGHVGSNATSLATAFTLSNAFTIPINFFTGTWNVNDAFTFTTTAYVAAGGLYGDNHSGVIKLGTMLAPAFVRMEAVYTFPNGTDTMTIIFPRANVVSSVDLDLQAEDAAAVTISFESKGASSDTSGGNAVWDSMSLGQILFA